MFAVLSALGNSQLSQLTHFLPFTIIITRGPLHHHSVAAAWPLITKYCKRKDHYLIWPPGQQLKIPSFTSTLSHNSKWLGHSFQKRHLRSAVKKEWMCICKLRHYVPHNLSSEHHASLFSHNLDSKKRALHTWLNRLILICLPSPNWSS